MSESSGEPQGKRYGKKLHNKKPDSRRLDGKSLDSQSLDSKKPGSNQIGHMHNDDVDAVASGPIKKNPIESVITTLPIIMLLGGLAFYYFNERRQVGGQILIDQIEEFQGEYSGISAQSDKPDAQRILWVKTPSRLRGGRVDYLQAQQLDQLANGAPLTVWAAPKVQGSKTLWVVKASSNGKMVISGIVDPQAPVTSQ